MFNKIKRCTQTNAAQVHGRNIAVGEITRFFHENRKHKLREVGGRL